MICRLVARKPLALLFVAFLTALFFTAGPAEALEVKKGQIVKVRSWNMKGVPLNRHPRPSIFRHLRDKTHVEVIQTTIRGKWVRIRLDDGTEAWIKKRHISKIVEQSKG